jgi:hypothetical protein
MNAHRNNPYLAAASLVALVGVTAHCAPVASTDSGADARADTSADVSHDADASLPDVGIDPPDVPRIDAGPWSPDDPGIFVAVGYGGRRIRSLDDGATWIDDQEIAAHGGDDTNLLRTIVWGGGSFVALGWRAMTSPDAQIWTDASPNLGQWIGAAIWAQGQFVSIGGYGWRRTSPDGVNWTAHDATPPVACHSHDALAFGDTMGGRYVMIDDEGGRFWANDGFTWTASAGGDATEREVAYGNGVFVAVGPSAAVRSTDGGANWTAAGTFAAPVSGLVFAQGQFLAIAAGHAYTSTDGTSWTDHADASVPTGLLAYGHGWYVSAWGGTIQRSRDGIAWTSVFSSAADANSFEWIAFGAPPGQR